MSMNYNPPSNTFCVLPWIHLSTRPNGHLRLCCTANASSAGATNDKKYGGEVGILKNDNGLPSNLNISDLNTSWNNMYMQTVRREMIEGKKPVSCLKCFKEEDAGYLSKRNWETDYWSKRVNIDRLLDSTTNSGVVPPEIAYVDLRLGTKCNLKCIMCSPHDSSAWVPDWKKLFPKIKNEALKENMNWEKEGRVAGASYQWYVGNDDFWTQFYAQLPNMQQIYFAGGEPLLIKEHYEILEKCIELGLASKIELRYNSNGTIIPQKLYGLWDQFKLVRFNFSIDSVGEKNTYIRFPSKWETIEKNLRELDNTSSNVQIFISCAIQALNIHDLPELVEWKLEQNFKKINIAPYGGGMVGFHFVYHPAHLNVKILPREMKEAVSRKIEDFANKLIKAKPNGVDLNSPYGIRRLRAIISFMNSEDWSNRWGEFKEYTALMDQIRNTSLEKTFPYFSKFL